MKSIFIYYSNTGNGDAVAEYLKERSTELRAVKPKKELPKPFFFKMLTGGFRAGIGAKDELVNFDANVKEYDSVMIGSPIWNGRLSTPINTVLSEVPLNGKKVVFVLYSASGEAKNAVELLSDNYPDAKIIIVKEPKKYAEELKKLDVVL